MGPYLGPIGGRYRLAYRVGVESCSLVKHFSFDINFSEIYFNITYRYSLQVAIFGSTNYGISSYVPTAVKSCQNTISKYNAIYYWSINWIFPQNQYNYPIISNITNY